MTVAEELRRVGRHWWRLESAAAACVWEGAVRSLGLERHAGPLASLAEDVSSEAIEAAEALGL